MCITEINRSTLYYESKEHNDKEVIDVLNHFAQKHPRNGFKKLFFRIRNAGYEWTYKRVYRIYKQLGLNIRRKTKTRLPQRIKTSLEDLDRVNDVYE